MAGTARGRWMEGLTVTYQEDRAAAIGALRRLADWVEAHPEAPAPHFASASYVVNWDDEPNEAIRMAGVIGTARKIGAQLLETDSGLTALVTLTEGHGPAIDYRVVGIKDTQRPRRYLDEVAE